MIARARFRALTITIPIISLSLLFTPNIAAAYSPLDGLFYHQKAKIRATELQSQLDSIGWPAEEEYNNYSTDGDVVWGTPGSPTTYKAFTECAPFVTKTLRRAYDWATNAYFADEFNSQSPNSEAYYDKLKADTLDHFDRVPFNQVKVGDMLAIKYASGGSGGSSGHMGFITSIQEYEKDGNLSTKEYLVRVVDSTSNPHGIHVPSLQHRDTRTSGLTEYDGVGQGYMVFKTAQLGILTGHWWGPNEDTFHAVSDRPIVFGRITENP